MSGNHGVQDASKLGNGILEVGALRPPPHREAVAVQRPPTNDVVIGEVIGLTDGGRTPLVVCHGRPRAEAVPARSVVDLHRAHIGKQVVVMFESGYHERPIVMGVLRDGEGWSLDDQPGTVEVDADGRRLILSAKQELVIRCGKASIILGRNGKITIRGTQIVSHAEDVNRIRGGSVQLN